MSRILLRARRDPFDLVSPRAAAKKNAIGSNVGNLLFSGSTYRMLSTPGTELVVDRFHYDPDAADRINGEFDAYVIPLANSFRPGYESTLLRLTDLIRRLTIPVVVVGVGAQATLEGDAGALGPLDRIVRDFVAAVLDRSASVGVRGEFTRDYLGKLGFRDVEVIGCPSLFMHGGSLNVEKKTPALGPESRVAVNVSARGDVMAELIDTHAGRFGEVVYIPQDLRTLRLLAIRGQGKQRERDEALPIPPSHHLFRDDSVRFFLDPWPWMSFLGGMDFSIGTRIHGNVAALLGGTPAMVLAHDSRTLELASYFDIPHRLVTELGPETDIAALYEEADYSALVEGHPARFARFLAFLEANGLAHVHAGDDGRAFDERIAATTFPGPVRVRAEGRTGRHRGRVGRLRRRLRDSALLRRVRERLRL